MLFDPLKNHWLRRVLHGGKRIVILMHEGTSKAMLNHYSIFKFTPTWIEDGHQVTLALGSDRFVPGDLVIVHVDLSVVPERFLDIARRYPLALNARIRDIRKSTISRQLIGPDSTWTGQVIVKSNLNHAGRPERKLLGVEPAQRIWQGPGEAPIHFGELDDYRLYEHLDQVPERYFSDPGLVVERFLPEMHDGRYHVRTCHVLGGAANAYRHGSANPLVKMSTIVTREAVEPHPGVVALGRELGLDYGKIDYVEHAGEAIVLDVNKTTGGGRMTETPELLAARARRARSLYRFWGD